GRHSDWHTRFWTSSARAARQEFYEDCFARAGGDLTDGRNKALEDQEERPGGDYCRARQGQARTRAGSVAEQGQDQNRRRGNDQAPPESESAGESRRRYCR